MRERARSSFGVASNDGVITTGERGMRSRFLRWGTWMGIEWRDGCLCTELAVRHGASAGLPDLLTE